MEPSVVVKPSSSKRFIALTAVVILVVLAIVGALTLTKNFKSGQLSPYILSITSPVNSISGTIKNIQGNQITLEYFNNPQLPPQPLLPGFSPQSSPQNVVFYINVTDQTVIRSQLKPTILTATPSASSKLSLGDLSVGDFISVTSKQDLRTLNGDTFDAVSILVLPKVNSLGIASGSAIQPPTPQFIPPLPLPVVSSNSSAPKTTAKP